ncbi:MAG: phosphoenolpyruvate carboxykinase (ATP) [Salinibacter sp.]|uniref:phosphoenolpyruvate carboxykinase (ATP) n=1 Tax=Salinibacter sp. TaxID=2065818 RepID=UPI002FC32A70
MHVPDHVSSHLGTLQLAPDTVSYNLKRPCLYEEALARNEGRLAADGPLVTRTTPHTGRSPKDRFIVRDASVADQINWGEVNQPTDRATFDHLHARMADHAEGRDLFVQDLYAGWDEDYRLPVRIITEKAWHSLFARNMFVQPDGPVPDSFEPSFTVVDLCEFEADPARDGTQSEAAIFVDIEQNLILIGGTHYGGEIKKSIFSVLSYLLPDEGVLPMHCSANESDDGSTAVFFGLSGTGKTTLSADAGRTLIGDDEHGWSDRGVYNFEGGCYAKMIDITPESEPEIYGTTEEFGTILENVIVDPESREPDFSDDTITQNTRGSYPLSALPHAAQDGQGGHPDHVLFLTYDAFGVLPPVSELSPAQAMYHFLSGYTAKVAGTEAGVSEPKATFSTCFGEPFMVRSPAVYAELLGEKIHRHDADCWLVNTGLTGGPYGEGHRIELTHTRAMVDAILDDRLADVPRSRDPVFGLSIPDRVPGVPSTLLTPRQTWDDPAAYDRHARTLVEAFADNFETYAGRVSETVRTAGPSLETAHG